MIKKTFHLLCVIVSGAAWTALLTFLLRMLFMSVYELDLLDVQTYRIFQSFWEEGGVLGAKELLLLLALFLSIPLCLFGWFKLNKFAFMKILTVPLNWLANRGLKSYRGMTSVNIKNLKMEEKKTIEQIVEERLEKERKKAETQMSETNFRSAIIEKIEEEKGEI